ncbi:MAG: hypothetical protein ACT4NL_09625 [Pseudomarimonas sp.]
MNRTPVFLAVAMLVAGSPAGAGVFLKFGGQPASQVVHPKGYNGSGAALNISVCLNPNLPATGGLAQAEQSVRNAVAEYNRLQGKVGNVITNPTPNDDFEGVLLHELGHCLGMDHTTFGPSEVGSGSPLLYFANAGPGTNATINAVVGADNVRATRDDARSDDVNFNWFRSGNNNPFDVLPATIDRTTYSINTANLPGGHNYVEVATSFGPCNGSQPDSSTLRGQPRTQNTMFPVICGNNLLRELSRDDAALLRIARAGVNGVQGNADDYTATLTYVGQTSTCDIVIGFANSTGYAQCDVGATLGGGLGTDAAITTAVITHRLSVPWAYNQVDTTNSAVGPQFAANSPANNSTTAMGGGTIGTQLNRNITFTVSGGSGAGTTQLTCTVGSGTVSVASGSPQTVNVGGSANAVVARFTLTASAQTGVINCAAVRQGAATNNFSYTFTANAGTVIPASRVFCSGFEIGEVTGCVN